VLGKTWSDHLQWAGAFSWEHLVKDSEEARVKITKPKPITETTVTPTCCGGHEVVMNTKAANCRA
jgi:hypothetical protein